MFTSHGTIRIPGCYKRFSRWMCGLALLLPLSCQSAGVGDVADGYVIRFALGPGSTDSMPAAPFPSDFYTAEQNERSPIVSMPAMVSTSLMPSLLKLGGAGPQQAVYFPFSKPQAAAVVLDAEILAARTGLLRVDGDAPEFHPAEVALTADGRAIVVMPELGRPLQPGARYLAYALVGATKGLSANPDFGAILREGISGRWVYVSALRDAVGLLRTRLKIGSSEIASATVFTVQNPLADIDNIAADIDAMNTFVLSWSGPHYGSPATPVTALMGTPERAVPGRDIPGGMISESVAEIRIGTLEIAAWSDSNTWSEFSYGAGGRPVPKSKIPVEFLLVLPDCARPVNGFPVVLAQHGLNDEKSFGLVIAEVMARECLAVLAIDAVAHGSRARRTRDIENIVTGEPVPDGLTDVWLSANIDQLYLIRPLVARANLLDTVASWLQVERSIELGLWKETGGAPILDPKNVGFIGQSMGGIVSAMFLGVSRNVSVGVVNVGGGNFTVIAESSSLIQSASPALSGLFLGDLFEPTNRWAFELSLLQGVMDGADPVNFAARWSGHPEFGIPRKKVLIQAAARDQLIPNLSTATLAKAAGAVRVGNGGEEFPLYGAPEKSLPFTLGDGGRAAHAFLTVVDGADHLMINEECSFLDHQVDYPFTPFPRESIENPILSVQQQAAKFIASSLRGVPVIDAVGAGKVVGRDCEGLSLAVRY